MHRKSNKKRIDADMNDEVLAKRSLEITKHSQKQSSSNTPSFITEKSKLSIKLDGDRNLYEDLTKENKIF